MRSSSDVPGFGMDAVAVEEFQFFGARREPGFVQAVVF